MKVNLEILKQKNDGYKLAEKTHMFAENVLVVRQNEINSLYQDDLAKLEKKYEEAKRKLEEKNKIDLKNAEEKFKKEDLDFQLVKTDRKQAIVDFQHKYGSISHRALCDILSKETQTQWDYSWDTVLGLQGSRDVLRFSTKNAIYRWEHHAAFHFYHEDDFLYKSGKKKHAREQEKRENLDWMVFYLGQKGIIDLSEIWQFNDKKFAELVCKAIDRYIKEMDSQIASKEKKEYDATALEPEEWN